MDRIAQAAVRMGQLISDLLEFSRVGRESLRKVHIDVNQLVTEVLYDLHAQIGDRSIVWRISALPAVVADGSLLRQVLINLLSNAIKYTGTVAEAKIEVGVLPREEPEAVTVFYVRDNGVGFDMKDAEKLFHPFSRLHSQAVFEGNGIGLSIVNSIIQRHGGRVWLDAQVGIGATAYFTLPG
jgi:light-regulated signal transduction histidine kinase (bacteriophytochrome)